MGDVLLWEDLHTLDIISELVVFELNDRARLLIELHLIGCDILYRSLQRVFDVLIIDPRLIKRQSKLLLCKVRGKLLIIHAGLSIRQALLIAPHQHDHNSVLLTRVFCTLDKEVSSIQAILVAPLIPLIIQRFPADEIEFCFKFALR